jgi:hypothetical protein
MQPNELAVPSELRYSFPRQRMRENSESTPFPILTYKK